MKKIVCICGNGLGSSFLLEMNVKAVLKDLNRTDIEVEHSDMGSAYKGMANLIICANDLKDNLTRFGNTAGLNNIMSKSEIKTILEDFLNG